jgi:hypothetical protein
MPAWVVFLAPHKCVLRRRHQRGVPQVVRGSQRPPLPRRLPAARGGEGAGAGGAAMGGVGQIPMGAAGWAWFARQRGSTGVRPRRRAGQPKARVVRGGRAPRRGSSPAGRRTYLGGAFVVALLFGTHAAGGAPGAAPAQLQSGASAGDPQLRRSVASRERARGKGPARGVPGRRGAGRGRSGGPWRAAHGPSMHRRHTVAGRGRPHGRAGAAPALGRGPGGRAGGAWGAARRQGPRAGCQARGGAQAFMRGQSIGAGAGPLRPDWQRQGAGRGAGRRREDGRAQKERPRGSRWGGGAAGALQGRRRPGLLTCWAGAPKRGARRARWARAGRGTG